MGSFQPVLLLIMVCATRPGISAADATWIRTNTVPGAGPATNFLGVYDLTPSVSEDVPNSGKYYNNLTRLILRVRERVVLRASAKATYGGKMVADYDVRSPGSANTSGMENSELRQVWKTNQSLLKAGYYRGRLYYVSGDADLDEWITVFSSADKSRVAVVHDSGPVYVSQNGGLGWVELARSGEYEFILCTSALGSELVAIVSLPQTPAAGTNSVHNMATENWYSVSSDASGSQIVLTGGPTQSAPVLSIQQSANTIVISWAATFSGFRLQHNSDPSAAEWVDVTDPVNVVGAQHEVILPASTGKKFFRLKQQSTLKGPVRP